MTDQTARRARAERNRALWETIHAERAALAADLAGLGDRRWETPSLCEGLSVRQVLAHLTAGAGLTWGRWMAGVVKCRFDFDEQVLMRLKERLGRDAAETLRLFEEAATSTTRMIPLKALLGEIVVHGEDIRRPLGIERAYPIEALTLLAEYYRRSDFVVVAEKRVAGLRLVAEDGPFAAGAGAAGHRHHAGVDDGDDRTRGVLRRAAGRGRPPAAGTLRDHVSGCRAAASPRSAAPNGSGLPGPPGRRRVVWTGVEPACANLPHHRSLSAGSAAMRARLCHPRLHTLRSPAR